MTPAALADAASMIGQPLHVDAGVDKMSDAEFDAAVRAKAWRGPAAAASPAQADPQPDTRPGNTAATAPTPEPAQPKGRRAAINAMTDREFDAAVKNRAWR